MTLASLRELLAVRLKAISGRIVAHPKAALVLWFVSLAVVAWVF